MKEFPRETYKALDEEIEGILKRKVWQGAHWRYLSKAERAAVLRSSAFVRNKLDQFNNILKWKARIVTDGSMQDRTKYSEEEISSPTVKLSSIFTLATIAAALGLEIQTSDVAQAFLNSEMPNTVHVILNEIVSNVLCQRDPTFNQFKDIKGRVLVKLLKGQYGCIESAKLWYNTISNFLTKCGYEKNKFDECVFQKFGDNGNRIYVAIYVDDIFTVATDKKMIDELNQLLEKEFGEMKKNRSKVHEYLGMSFDFSEASKVKINMKKFLNEVISESNITSIAETPAAENLFNISDNSPLLNDTDREKFHSTVAKLLYAGVRVRPDILLPIIFLSSRVTKATTEDAKKLRRVLRYLNGTVDMGITLRPDTDGALRIHTYADASYGVHGDCKSHTGIMISLGGGPVLCKSVKQKIVTKSSTEAELVALSDATSLASYQLNFMESLGFNFEPVIMHQDNQSTINLANNGISNSDRTKHIKIRYFFIKQFIDSGEFVIEYCPTEVMLADLLTKPIQGRKFIELRNKLLGSY